MTFQITPDQKYCCFNNASVYEFIPFIHGRFKNTCWECSFMSDYSTTGCSPECKIVPCQPAYRRDNKDGYWIARPYLSYDDFKKLLNP